MKPISPMLMRRMKRHVKNKLDTEGKYLYSRVYEEGEDVVHVFHVNIANLSFIVDITPTKSGESVTSRVCNVADENGNYIETRAEWL